MLGSNQRPLPCEVSTRVFQRFLEFAKSLEIGILFAGYFSRAFKIFVWVAARLLRTSSVRSALASFSLRVSLTRIRPFSMEVTRPLALSRRKLFTLTRSGQSLTPL